ncbi:MAG TPA: ATP-dependent Clp protease ATP-binding subunit [Nocardioidaceae bacterium]|nr:ATP-dependent Clp protease ATP-binding subunit [Nocardioidaceae bacterium]
MATFFGPADFESGSFDDFFARLLGSGGGAGGAFRRVDITELMAEETHRLLADAAADAGELGHADLDVPHLLRATTRQDSTRQLLARAGVDPDALADAVHRQLPPGREGTRGSRPANLTAQARKALLDSYQVARSLGASYISPEHVLLAMAADEESGPGQLLGQGATAQRLADSAAAGGRDGGPQSSTPTLDEFGEDLTARARDGRLDPLVGRQDEIDQTIEVLARRTKNNPALIGEPGVGKTAIVEGIAQRIAAGDVPGTLLDKRVVQLNLSGMLAGTRYRGDFEERMTKVIDEVTRHRDEVIVFIDELHTVVGAGGAEGAVDAGNMLKPRLARGELNVVGATTLEEYRKHIEKDPALERRFQPVLVSEPSVEDTIAVLHGLRERYEDHHQVSFTDAALEAAARLSDRYVADRFLPDKAIDLIDQAGARKRLRVAAETPDAHELGQRLERLVREKDDAVRDERYERASQLRDEITALHAELTETDAAAPAEAPEVTAVDIAEIVSRATGVPVSQLTETEKVRLQNLEGELHRRVVGQDDAVEAIARSVRRSRSGMGDPRRPVGSFLFVGPTGVGKTELAKALAETLFGSEDRMVRVDMSEFGERHTVSRLFGAPPGYVGYGDSAGELTESVRRRPYSVVLLDEVEKAHPDVFNMLLQVLEDGRLTDGSGRTVDFTNTVVIMTSNVGSDLISTSTGTLGFTSPGHGGTVQDMRDRLMPKLRDVFRPEFLNRVDEIVTFGRLRPDQLRTITRLLLEHTERRLASQDVAVDFSEQAVAWLAERGHQPEFGARPLRRTIQRELDDRVADLLLDGRLVAGGRLVVDVGDGDLTFDVQPRALQPTM